MHAVAATDPTVIVPDRSEESEERDGVVPHEESTGVVLLAAMCPLLSTAKIGPVDVAEESERILYRAVVVAVLAVT